MSKTERTLRYIGPNHDPRDRIDHAFESFFASLGRAEVSGLENIPSGGPLVIGYLPHSGWVGPFVIDHCLRSIRPPAVWITRKETEDQLPHFLLGRRKYLFLNRKHPEEDYLPTTSRILAHPQGCLATAFEGTRKGNRENPNDLRTLGNAVTGIVEMASLGNAPILPVIVLGEDQIIPQPERIPFPPYGVIYELGKALLTPKKPKIQITFLPPYFGHIIEGYDGLSISERSQHRKLYTNKIMRLVIPKLFEMDPNYPLGPYSKLHN